MAIASHTPAPRPRGSPRSRFTADNNLFHRRSDAPHFQANAAVKGAAEQQTSGRRGWRSPGPAGRGSAPSSPCGLGDAPRSVPTVDGIDYPSSAFSNENVRTGVYR